ncbi:tyrosine-type recombinase/integrase [Pseudonocardia sp. NPDC049154]|uniref:tyrosine-type recombinase/integrase n=1 Tax=Pseudonocardia sp. NPDC049154 TaxID=3155501 RepID=UPI003401A713
MGWGRDPEGPIALVLGHVGHVLGQRELGVTIHRREAALDAARTRYRNGVGRIGLQLGTYLSEWIAGRTDLADTSRRSYAGHIRNHLAPRLGHIKLDDLRVAHVAEAFAEIPVSDSTRQRVRATLRAALNDAMRESLIPTNPAALVRLPSGKRPKALIWTEERVSRWSAACAALAACDLEDPDRERLEEACQPPSPVMVWTPTQLGAFLDRAHHDRLYALWHVVAHRGLRRGEACGVAWEDVDLSTGLMAIRRQLVQNGWEVIESKPKSEAGNRFIALDAGTVATLQAHKEQQDRERAVWGEAYQESGRVFTKENGEALHPASVTTRFHHLAEEIGLPPVRLHDLRHGAASLMLAAGVPMKVVQETLGHSSVTLTADTYTSVCHDVAASAAEAVAALIPRARAGSVTHRPRTHSPEDDHPEVRSPQVEGGGPREDRTHNPRIKKERGVAATYLDPAGQCSVVAVLAALVGISTGAFAVIAAVSR